MKFKQDKKKMTLMVAPVLIKPTKFLVHATKKKLYPNSSESFLQFRGLNLVCWMVRVIIKEFLLCVAYGKTISGPFQLLILIGSFQN